MNTHFNLGLIRGGKKQMIQFSQCMQVYAFPSSVVCFLFAKAKQHYEREEKKKELKRLKGEDTWMLPEVNQRLQQIEQVRCYVCLWSCYKVCVCVCARAFVRVLHAWL